MSNIEWWMYVLWVVVGVLVGWWIGSLKGYPTLGAVLGIFTVVGWILTALLPARDDRAVSAPAVDSGSRSPRPPDVPSGRMPHHPPDVAVMRDHDDDT